jgi:hypothetical protein
MATTRRIVLKAGAMALGLALAGALPAAAADVSLAAGSKVPAFSVTDQNGGMQNLETLTRARGAVLIFTRSLHW